MNLREDDFVFCSVSCSIFITFSLSDLTSIIAIFLEDGNALGPKMNEQISEL